MIAAASRLFADRGVNRVSLADIAEEVGLARNSLYRYFPDKGHILGAWFRSELAPLIDRCIEIATRDDPPLRRLDAWLVLQLDYLVAPEHQAMLSAASELASLSEGVRADIGDGHRELYGTLATIVEAQLLLPDAAAGEGIQVLTMFIVGLLRSASDLVLAGHDQRTTSIELLRAARSVLTG